MIALTALGNRIWGEKTGSHLLGCFLMTMGLVIGHSYPLWAWPVIYGLVFLWRVWSPGPWFEFAEGQGGWQEALGRSLWVLPLGVGLAVLNGSLYPLLAAVAGVGMVPMIYADSYKLWLWLGWKLPAGSVKFSYTELAELFAGAYLGVIGL